MRSVVQAFVTRRRQTVSTTARRLPIIIKKQTGPSPFLLGLLLGYWIGTACYDAAKSKV